MTFFYVRKFMAIFHHLYRALQEAQDIFGVDFNFDEFDQYGDDYEEDDEDDEEEVCILFINTKMEMTCPKYE